MSRQPLVESIIVRFRAGDEGFELTLDMDDIQTFFVTRGDDPDFPGLPDRIKPKRVPVGDLRSGDDCMKIIRPATVRRGVFADFCWHCLNCDWHCPPPDAPRAKGA